MKINSWCNFTEKIIQTIVVVFYIPKTGSFLMIPFRNKSSMAGRLRKNFRNFSLILFLWPLWNVMAVAPLPPTPALPGVLSPETEVGLVGDGFSSRSSSLEPKIFIFSDLVRPTLLAFLEAGNCKVLLWVVDIVVSVEDLLDLGLVFNVSMIFWISWNHSAATAKLSSWSKTVVPKKVFMIHFY